MIQDIAPHTYHNEYKPVAPDKESHILAYEEGKILMKKDGETMTLPSFGELEGKVENLYENYIYLFSVDEEHFYLIPDLDTSLLPGYQFEITRVTVSGFRRNHRISALSVVQQAPFLRLLRKTDGT